MSYYSDLGSYSAISAYPSLYLPGPYSNHSSIIASNFTRPTTSLLKPFQRNFRGYKPHLSTITERSQSPLRRLNSPKFTPSLQIPRPIKINTADIDVSVNKYRKYDRPRQRTEPPSPQATEKDKSKSKSPSPGKTIEQKPESPAGSFKEQEAKPTKVIKRDRATVRLHTIHKDKVPNDVINTYRKWRDNFDPRELYIEEAPTKTVRKTPGELLKEKFLIKDKDDVIIEEEDEKPSKQKVERTPSFHDICRVISSENVNEMLNPGQPEKIRRRQSRKYSSEDLLKKIRRNSAELSREEVAMLDSILQTENITMEPIKEDTPQSKTNSKKIADEGYDSRGSFRKKKKITKKKSGELSVSDISDSDIPKSPLQRRPTQKYIRRTSTSSSIGTDVVDADIEKMYQHAIRDISQVEIEEIKKKPKPIVTATVEVEEIVNPQLKAVIDNVVVEEAPLTPKTKRKFNVFVEEVEEKRKSIEQAEIKRRNADKFPKLRATKSVIKLPKAKEPLISNVLAKRSESQQGSVPEEKKLPEVQKVAKEEATAPLLSKVEKRTAEEKPKSPVPKVQNVKREENKLSPSKLAKVQSVENIQPQKAELRKVKSEESKFVESKLTTPKTADDKTVTIKKGFPEKKSNILSKVQSMENVPSQNKSVTLRKTNSEQKVEEKKEEKTPQISKTASTSSESISRTESIDSISASEKNPSSTPGVAELQKVPSKSSMKVSGNAKSFVTKKVVMKEVEEEQLEPVPVKKVNNKDKTIGEEDKKTDEVPKTAQEPVDKAETAVSKPAGKMISKRSLVNKSSKVDDPEMEVFKPPEPEPLQTEEKPQEEEEEEEEKKDAFVPLQSNRLSQWMHPWKKPEQQDECPIEIYARPKTIRKRHYPRPRHPPQQVEEESSSSEEEEEETSSDEESSSEDEEGNLVRGSGGKVGASTSSNDSGIDSAKSGAGTRNKDCDVNCHKKCEKLTANLCGINQKLIVEAIESVKRGSASENRESPTSNPANNPALALENDVADYTKSSTFIGFQKSGRITPPATTIPRFRKYILDDFTFLKVLGKGSFGKVLLAELKGTEYYYAIKCLKKDVVLEDDDVECTLIERKVLALGTKHPYLCHLLCTFQTDSHLFFVMEYLNGGDLMFHIQQSGRFSEDRARFYGAEIVSGLKFLHNKGIVYRDLKLDNILLDYDGHVRIADFGMCKLQIFLDRMADTFCGTPDYMAPEIIKGQHYNQCVDWWSFGVLLYEMLIGQSPFSGCDEDELFWSICNEKPVLPRFLSTEAREILSRFLEKDANKRLGNRFSSYGDIQDQPFFSKIDWHMLEARQLEAPFRPRLLHPLDTQYFDKTFTAEKAKLTPIEETILQSMDQTQFQGFSYTNPNATDK